MTTLNPSPQWTLQDPVLSVRLLFFVKSHEMTSPEVVDLVWAMYQVSNRVPAFLESNRQQILELL